MNRTTGLAAIVLAVLGGHAAAEDGGAVTGAPAGRSESQQAAYTMLMEMANYLAGIESFSVTMLAGYDAVQEDGQKIEFLESRKVTVARPNRLRVEEKSADGHGRLIVFDGSKLTISDGAAGVYAQADQPGSVDDTILYFIRDLKMRLPLAILLTTRFPEELERRIRTIDYVEMTDALAEPTHQIAGRTGTLDFQVWIADGDQPLPLRIVLTYADAGQPQHWVEFSDWNLRPRTRDKTFTFKVPRDARQIPFAIQLSMLGDALPPDGATTGGGAKP